MSEKLYPDPGPGEDWSEDDELARLYALHVEHMTSEGLHDKSEIAWQFALRDKRLRESEAREAALVAGLRDAVAKRTPRGTREPHEDTCARVLSEGSPFACSCIFGMIDALLREHEQRREQRQGGTTT